MDRKNQKVINGFFKFNTLDNEVYYKTSLKDTISLGVVLDKHSYLVFDKKKFISTKDENFLQILTKGDLIGLKKYFKRHRQYREAVNSYVPEVPEIFLSREKFFIMYNEELIELKARNYKKIRKILKNRIKEDLPKLKMISEQELISLIKKFNSLN